MRRALIVMALLFALGLGGTAAAFVQVNGQRDQVVLTEEILFGDKANAEGLAVRARANVDAHLHWDTTHIIGAQPMTTTDFRYTAKAERDWWFEHSGIGFEYLHNQISRNNWMDAQSADGLSGLDLAYWELLQETKPGEDKERVIRIGDYYDYYPIRISLDIPAHIYGEQGEWLSDREEPENEIALLEKKLSELFVIPVLPEETMWISVGRNENGKLGGTGSSSGERDHFWMEVSNVVADNACYFILGNRSADGKIMDFSRGGGYGIYIIPYLQKEDAPTTIDLDGVGMVYPLAQDSRIVWFTAETEQERLLLLTLEEEAYYVLRVIDCADMSTVQEMVLGTPEETRISAQVCREGYLVFRTAQGGLMVLEERDGLYEVALDITLTEQEEISGGVGVSLWDGERLAVVVGPQYEQRHSGEMCCFTAAVYDRTGALFGARYLSSLDTKNYDYYHYLSCGLVEVDPLELSWAE